MMLFNRLKQVSIALGCLLCSIAVGSAQSTETNWTQINPNPAPPSAQNAAMVYDSARGVCVMYGGWLGSGRGSTTWEWDGTTWTSQQPLVSPGGRDAIAMVYDSNRKVTILTGGYVGPSETWEYDGTTWKQILTATQHTATAHAGMAYDSDRLVSVLFQAGQTWEYNGLDWKLIPTAVSPTSGSNLAYDSLRKKTVLFLGTATWEYDGSNWTQIVTNTVPTGRGGTAFGLVYDSVRQMIVMFAGSAPAMGDTWEYDGTDWRMNTTVNTPSFPRSYVAMAYDSSRKRTVLYGGRDFSGSIGGVIVGDTWEYSGGPCSFSSNQYSITMATGGSQIFSLDGEPANAGKPFFIFGSMSGTAPGFSLFGAHIPLNIDLWTSVALGAMSSGLFVNYNGVLDQNGRASASIVVPPLVMPGFTVHQAYIVIGGNPLVSCASNSVVTELK